MVLYLYFLVNLLSLLLTYINVTIIYIIFLRKKIWDYAITVALFHLAVTCAGKILKWTTCISYTLIFQSQYCSSSQIGVKSQEFVLFIKAKLEKKIIMIPTENELAVHVCVVSCLDEFLGH